MESTCLDTSLNLNLVPSLHHRDLMGEGLEEELHRLSSENKKLTETLTHMCESYHAMQKHLSQLMNMDSERRDPSRKRKLAESGNCANNFGILGNICNNNNMTTRTECSTSTIEEELLFKRQKEIASLNKVTKVLVKTEASDPSLYVMDGYQWRKYGQKVTRDNPSPRAYFRCSFAPSCQVKKKVQKSVEDPTILVATYEGEHNHCHHRRAEISLITSQSETPLVYSPTSIIPSNNKSPSVTLDLVKSTIIDNAQKSSTQKFLVQQMAASLTRDPNFTAALATAISGRILDQTSEAK